MRSDNTRSVSNEELEEAQRDYDATPAGFMELERRIRDENKSRYRSADVIQEYTDRLQGGKARRAAQLAAIKSSEQGDVGNHTKEPIVTAPLLSSAPDEWMDIDRRDAVGIEVRNFLVDASEGWTSNLDPEEIEAVSWGTSNGTGVIRAHMAGGEHEIWGYDKYPAKHLDRTKELLDGAMDKAPVLEEPINIYRGLNTETFGEWHNVTVDEVQEMFPPGSDYTPPFPESATLHPKIAYGFSQPGVVMQIQSKTLASPVNVGAWGTSEMEVLVNHRKKYKIKDVSHKVWGKNNRDEDRDLIVITMEEYEPSDD